MSEQVTSITGFKTMTALNPANSRALQSQSKSKRSRRVLSRQLRTNVGKRQQSNDLMRQTQTSSFPSIATPTENLNRDMMKKEKAQSHYLIAKITGRKSQRHKPGFSMETHGEAQQYLDNYDSSIKIKKDEDEEGVDLSRAHADDEEQDNDKQVVPQALKPTSWTKIDQLITLLQNRPDETGEFYYLTPGSEDDPFDLKTNIMQSENTSKYFTISKKGITSYIDSDPVDFTSLNDWLHERKLYNEFRQKKFFKQF